MHGPLSRRRLLGQTAPATLSAIATAPTADARESARPPSHAGARSILDFGAVGDDRRDNTTAIQRAIDAVRDAGGGDLFVPAGIFRFESTLRLYSGVSLRGDGPASTLHFVNNRRGNALCAMMSRNARSTGIVVRDLTIAGDARYIRGNTPSVINGAGILFENADDCQICGVVVMGFSDGGIHFLNGNRNNVMRCRVEQVAQGICFTASDITVSGNIAVGNHIRNIGEYNGLHLEGAFGGKAKGEVRHTTLSANTIVDCWEAGINIELAPYTSCTGNTVNRAGLGRTQIAMGIKVYGGFRSAICSNTVTDCGGTGIVIGANSGECAVTGNTTAGNKASLLLTDSTAQVSKDVSVGLNAFAEGEISTSGNVSIRNRIAGIDLANHANPDPRVLDWYEEGRFQPALQGRPQQGERDAIFTRIGNIVHIAMRMTGTDKLSGAGFSIEGLPYPTAMETPLTAMMRFDDRYVPCTAVLSTSGRRIAITLQAPTATDERPAARSWHLSISGQYLTVD